MGDWSVALHVAGCRRTQFAPRTFPWASPPTGLRRPAEAFLDAFAQPLADRIAQARGDLARDGGLARLAVAWAAATSPPMVLHQDVAKIGQTALLSGAFAVKARILVRRRGDGLEKLQEQSPQKALRRDGRAPDPLGRRPKTSGRAQPAPHRSAAASPAAGASSGCAPRRPPTRTAPRLSLAPHRSLAIRLRQSSKNYARATNTRSSSGLFFSSLLG